MPHGPASIAPDGEEFPRTHAVVSRGVWDQAGRDVRAHRRRRRVFVVVLVALGAVVGALVPAGDRGPAIMVGTVAGGALALWTQSWGGRARRPAKRAVADALRAAGVPRVTVNDLDRIIQYRSVVAHHRQIESEVGEHEVEITVLDLSGRYWGPRGWSFVMRHAD